MKEYSIQEISRALHNGELVAIPTETVYGLAANALDPIAVKKIFEIKGRPLIDPIIIHIYDLLQAETLAQTNEHFYKLAKRFWPGPLTIILPKKPIVPDIVSAGAPTVGLRMPNHPILRKILKEIHLPLAAPSANPFGYVSPTEAEHVRKTLGGRLKYIVDGGSCSIGIESTVLDLTNLNKPKILRPGPISAEDIADVIDIMPGTSFTRTHEKRALPSPGLLESHYSPHTPLHLIRENAEPSVDLNSKIAVIRLKRPSLASSKKYQEYWLSEDGDLAEVAKNLFRVLQLLDEKKLSSIYIEAPANEGIGIAIYDRLLRACSK